MHNKPAHPYETRSVTKAKESKETVDESKYYFEGHDEYLAYYPADDKGMRRGEVTGCEPAGVITDADGNTYKTLNEFYAAIEEKELKNPATMRPVLHAKEKIGEKKTRVADVKAGDKQENKSSSCMNIM